MNNAIGRKRTMGISAEGTYGVPVASPTYVLSLLDTPRVEIKQNKIRNTAPLGSSYLTDSIVSTTRQANVSLSLKIDEDSLPLFFKQKFSIVSALVTGETSVYSHTMTYNTTNSGASYTLWIQDPDRTGQQISGVKFTTLNLKAESGGFVTLEATGIGQYPTTWTASNTVTQPNEFVGKNVTFSYGDYSGSSAAYSTLTLNANHTFGITGDDTNFVLGEEDLNNVFTTEDEFSTEIVSLFGTFDDRDDYGANTKKKWDFTVTDTTRFVTTSTANTSPSIKFNYPVGFVENWAENGGLGDILKQTLTLTPVDDVATSKAPLEIVVINAEASY